MKSLLIDLGKTLVLSIIVLITLLTIFALGDKGVIAEYGTTIKLDYVAGMDASGSATGIANQTINTQVIKGNYLYVGKGGNSTACSQVAGNAVGCELQIYDISNPENPVYVAGRDADGSSSGNKGVGIATLAIKGDYLFVGKNGNNTACSQNEGEAIGCELMVFDISSSTNPVYVAGVDGDGSPDGVFGGVNILSFVFQGDYLFVGRFGNGVACSQIAGSARGCELHVYNISNPINPTYVAGRDADGSASGTAGSDIRSLVISGNYLFVGKTAFATACSQVVGSAVGCELQVYDISNPENPLYKAGMDSSGSAVGTGNTHINSLVISGHYLFLGKDGNSLPCTGVPGSAIGCELMVFDISSSTNPVYVTGRDSNGIMESSSNTFILSLIIKGDYLFVGGFHSSIFPCSEIAGNARGCELQVYDISDHTNPIYVAGRDISGNNDGTDTGEVKTLVFKGDHLFLGKSSNATPCSQTPGLALGCELQIYSFSTFLNHTTSFTISQTINEEISLSLINPISFSTIPGLSGGTSLASTTFNIKTNSQNGYHASLNFSTTTAMQRTEGEGYINNYTPETPNLPDFTFQSPTTSHSFAYNVTSTTTNDIDQRFKHNNTSCNTGTNSSPTNCWYNQPNATISVPLINRQTPTTYEGTNYTLNFRVDVANNPSPSLPEGMYQATATVTVIAN